jgi:uncharacterized repeat protein (TIGR01451 family)
MKKVLYIIVSLLGLYSFAQPTNIVNSCGNNVFNLTMYNNVNYFLTESDAVNNVNSIPNPTNYVCLNPPQQIYVRINNPVMIYPIYLIVNPGLSVSIGGTLDIPQSTATASGYGGQEPYTYQWSINGLPIAGATEQFIGILTLPPGSLTVTVTDANGCSGQGEMNISGPNVYANDDSLTVLYNSTQNTTTQTSVLSNDFANGLPVNTPNNPVTVTGITVPNGFVLNPNGTISILSGTVSGTYTIVYQMCSLWPQGCDEGTATITNSNGIKDNGEHNFTNGQFQYQLNDNGINTNVDSSNGLFFISESNLSNSYDINYLIDNEYSNQYTLTTSTYSNVNASTGISTYYFPVVSIPFNDLRVHLYSIVPPRPGFDYTNYISVWNAGNQSISSATLTFNKDNALNIISTSESVTNSTSGFTYGVNNLMPGQQQIIIVTMQVPTIPTVSLGQLVTNTVSVSAPVGDINLLNNSFNLTQTIVGSYDPNDKTESHGGKILHSGFTANDYLNYTIRFENTGTAEAINIKVEDVLDSKLDENSIRMLASSHPYVLDRVGSNLKWNFNGVNLPPSSPASSTIGHGYIVFQVKPKPGFAVGDVIPNTANIYFDFNPAIVTNTCTTEFVSTLSNENFTFNNFKSFPNPVKNSLTISNASPIETIEISSILGQKMISKKINDIQTEIDLSQLSNGIYFVKVTSQGNEKTIKIVKE